MNVVEVVSLIAAAAVVSVEVGGTLTGTMGIAGKVDGEGGTSGMAVTKANETSRDKAGGEVMIGIVEVEVKEVVTIGRYRSGCASWPELTLASAMTMAVRSSSSNSSRGRRLVAAGTLEVAVI